MSELDMGRMRQQLRGIAQYQDALTRFLVHHLNTDAPAIGTWCMEDFARAGLEYEEPYIDDAGDYYGGHLFVVGFLKTGAIQKQLRFEISVNTIDKFMVELFTDFVKPIFSE